MSFLSKKCGRSGAMAGHSAESMLVLLRISMDSFAKLIDLCGQRLEIVKGLGAAARVAQQRCGMVNGHHLYPALFKPLPVFL